MNQQTTQQPKRKYLLITLVIVILAGGGFFSWYYLIGPGKKMESKTTIPTPAAGWETYKNEVYGYSINYPSNLAVKEQKTPGPVTSNLPDDQASQVVYNTIQFGNISEYEGDFSIVSSNESWENQVNTLTKLIPDVKKEDYVLGGEKAIKILIDVANISNNPDIKQGSTTIYVSHNDIFYKIVFNAKSNLSQEAINKILDSFRFTK